LLNNGGDDTKIVLVDGNILMWRLSDPKAFLMSDDEKKKVKIAQMSTVDTKPPTTQTSDTDPVSSNIHRFI